MIRNARVAPLPLLPPAALAVPFHPQTLTVGTKDDGAVLVGAADLGTRLDQAIDDLRAGVAKGIVRADGDDRPRGANGGDEGGGP